MDDVSPHREDSGNLVAAQTDDNNNNQTEGPEAPGQESDTPERDPSVGDSVEETGAPEETPPENETLANSNTEEPQPITEAIRVTGEVACHDAEKESSRDADTAETQKPEAANGEKEGEVGGKVGEREDENSKGQEVVKNGETKKEGEDMKEVEKEREGENNAKQEGKGKKTGEGKTEKGRKGDEEKVKKDTKIKGGGKGSEKESSKQVNVKEGGEEKDKGKNKEVEKQGKTKRKSGATSSPSTPSATPLALSRPRTSARSSRASTKNDIIAKFQQGAPETPVVRNFKLQKSSISVANGGSIKQKILQWCRNKTRNYEGVSIENFSSSWCDGLAFCAVVHRFFPDAFDFSTLQASEREKNFTLAFSTAESLADCCPLVEVADMILMGNKPDPLCVFTYVQALCQHLSKIEKKRRDSEKEEEEEEEKEKGTAEGEEKSEKMLENPTEKEDGEMVENDRIYGQQEKEKEGEESMEKERIEKKEEEEKEEGVLVGAQA